ncbi:MAG TPA: hypothetical protein VHS99_00740, partial [Chloroflexota bacterium]|nr:hypothetical protein [Chloroflexota bacterium]
MGTLTAQPLTPLGRFRRLMVTSASGAVRRRPATPAGAALRSALVPGWGQWAAGRRRRGLVLTGLALLATLLPLMGLLAMVQPLLPLLPLPDPLLVPLDAVGGLVRLATEPIGGWLGADDWGAVWRLAVAANAGAALFRAWTALDAARCARAARRAIRPLPRPSWLLGRVVPAAAGAAAGLLVVVPHLGFAAAGYAAQPIVAQVLVPPAPAPPARPAPPPEGAPPAAEPAGLDPQALPDLGRPVWDGKSRLNVLLLGTDRRPQEAAQQQWGNSDTILLVSVDPAREAAALVSVPRDLFLDIPGG